MEGTLSRLAPLLTVVIAVACTPVASDFDGDGAIDAQDCAPEDPAIHPAAIEVPDDGVDQDCDGVDQVCDGDGDGALAEACGGSDCDDSDDAVEPSAVEVCNGRDDNCDGDVPEVELDADADGTSTCDGDCADLDATRAPGLAETCDGLDNDCNGELPTDEADDDGDGALACADDCDDGDAERLPGAQERCNGLDDDCDGAVPADEVDEDADGALACLDCDDTDPARELLDADADGSTTCEGDCDDANPARFPGAADIADDGVDQDCSGADRVCDGDGDGALLPSCGGADCDDGNAVRFDGAVEICNGLDDDCDGNLPGIEADADGDGVSPCEGDCADLDPLVAPGLAEACDGVDNDCSGSPGVAEVDADADAFLACVECDDTDAERFPGAAERCNALDDDCDGVVPIDEGDADGDGALACGDCADDDNTSFPGGTETPYDGVDQDCSGADLIDVDGDGQAALVAGGVDCDDTTADVRVGAPDPPLDGLDANCDDVDGVDLDGDGYAGLSNVGSLPPALADLLDCDDNSTALNLDDVDWDGSTTCAGDCDDDNASLEALDADGDGASTCDGDCDDAEPLAVPAGSEVCDGLDNDCSGAALPDEVDADGDGDLACTDCDDNRSDAHTLDLDGDGRTSCGPDGVADAEVRTGDGDCDDTDPLVFPGAADEPDDGIDAKCDSTVGVDVDGDGDAAYFSDCDDNNASLNQHDEDADGSTTCNGDCDDEEPLAYPGNAEVPDLVDNECDGATDEGTPGADDDGDGACEGHDYDGDGLTECWDGAPAGDCDDADAIANPHDQDGDGFDSCGDGDCDDNAVLTHPGAAEQCDLEDNDCDLLVDEGVNDQDLDGDGVFPCQGDCDDFDARVFAQAAERCDGVDNDCDGQGFGGELDGDADGDGWLVCAGDCAPADGARNPGAPEVCDGVDNDCDGLADNGCETCDVLVPTDEPTLQAAIGALSGGVICLEAGTHSGPAGTDGKPLTILGLGGAAQVVVDGGGAGPVLMADQDSATTLEVAGLTVTGGVAAAGAGIRVVGGAVDLRQVVVVGNTAQVTSGHAGPGGLDVDGATLFMSDCLVEGNLGYWGGGVRLDGAADATIERSVFRGNAGQSGGGLFVTGSGTRTLRHVTLEENAASNGGAISLAAAATHPTPIVAPLVIEESLLAGNTAGGRGGGIYAPYADLVEVRRTALLGNLATYGLAVYAPGAPVFENVVFAGSGQSSGRDGGTLVLDGAAVVSFATFAGNDNGNRGGQIELAASASPTIEGSIIFGNSLGGISMASDSFTEYPEVSWSDVHATYGGYSDMPDPTGTNGNVAVDPLFLFFTSPGGPWRLWDLHLQAASPVRDVPGIPYLDPDGTPADMGAFGGPDADEWDIDGDGFPLWWHPGPYDPVADPIAGWDCDDLDPHRYPGHGC